MLNSLLFPDTEFLPNCHYGRRRYAKPRGVDRDIGRAGRSDQARRNGRLKQVAADKGGRRSSSRLPTFALRFLLNGESLSIGSPPTRGIYRYLRASRLRKLTARHRADQPRGTYKNATERRSVELDD